MNAAEIMRRYDVQARWERFGERIRWLREHAFLCVVIIPTAITFFYYTLMASDIYVSKAEFSVNVQNHDNVGVGSLALLPMLNQSSNLHDSYVVKEFFQSQKMLDELEQSIQLSTLYRAKGADLIARLSRNVTKEDYLVYFQKMNDVWLDEHSGIIHLRARAFRAEDAKRIAQEMLARAEVFVNAMSQRVQQDSIAFAERTLQEAEANLIKENDKLSRFRTKNKNFNPKLATQTVGEIMAGMEGELAKTEAEIANLQNYMKADSPNLQGLQAKAEALRSQINEHNKKLVDEKAGSLGKIVQSYASLEAEEQFALKRYQVTLASYEAAQAEARKQSIYLLRIEDPVLPQSAIEPLRIRRILTVFFGCLIAYLIGGVMISSVRGHIRP